MIYGAGAIGGVVGARLHQSGHDVLLIARGEHHDAIARHGLTLETPEERVTLRLPVLAAPSPDQLQGGDVVLLATKSQDTGGALKALRDAVRSPPPVVCLQNGVENERKALRLFGDVYGAVVMSPTSHLQPGVVQAYGTSLTGEIDVGRYPDGVDELCQEICEALRASRFDAEPRPEIMRHKYAKLINNLANAVEALCGPQAGASELSERVKAEGREILRTAGIEFEVQDVAAVESRWRRWGVKEIAGQPRGGGSTWQSVIRGGRIETDYLNGEIVLLARRHGGEAPLNALVQELANRTVREGRSPGWLEPEQILRSALSR